MLFKACARGNCLRSNSICRLCLSDRNELPCHQCRIQGQRGTHYFYRQKRRHFKDELAHFQRSPFGCLANAFPTSINLPYHTAVHHSIKKLFTQFQAGIFSQKEWWNRTGNLHCSFFGNHDPHLLLQDTKQGCCFFSGLPPFV